MLPDFPKIKNKILQSFEKEIRETIENDTLFQKIGEERLFEGNTSVLIKDNEEQEIKPLTIEDKIEVNNDEIIERGIQVLENIKPNLIKYFIKDKHKMLFDAVDNATRETGNVVDAKGKPFDFNTFIELLEKLQIDFNRMDKPIMPSIIIHPSMLPQIQAKLKEAENNPEFQKRMEQLIEQKKREWNDRESNRKLVD